MKTPARRGARALFIAVISTAAFFVTSAIPAGAASDALPDLQMAKIVDIRVDSTSMTGKRLLRFTTDIVNLGQGPFEVTGQRPDTATSQMTVSQNIFDTTGSKRTIAVPTASMYFAGDGHSHWHLRDLESYSLERLDNGVVVGTGAKHGFCFSDNLAFRLTWPNAPQTAQYRGCGTSTSLSVTTGLSVGWGDRYSSSLPDQWIDITGLKNGKYRLSATADAQGNFVEANNSNNFTYVDLQISGGNSVKVMRYGPLP